MSDILDIFRKHANINNKYSNFCKNYEYSVNDIINKEKITYNIYEYKSEKLYINKQAIKVEKLWYFFTFKQKNKI